MGRVERASKTEWELLMRKEATKKNVLGKGIVEALVNTIYIIVKDSNAELKKAGEKIKSAIEELDPEKNKITEENLSKYQSCLQLHRGLSNLLSQFLETLKVGSEFINTCYTSYTHIPEGFSERLEKLNSLVTDRIKFLSIELNRLGNDINESEKAIGTARKSYQEDKVADSQRPDCAFFNSNQQNSEQKNTSSNSF